MKKIVKSLLNLVLVAAVSVGLLFGMDALTASLIKQQAAAEVKQAFSGVLEGEKWEEMAVPGGTGDITAAYRVFGADGKLAGFAVSATVKGYGGDMRVNVALSPDGERFVGLRVGENRETEGYGSLVAEEAFYRQFDSLRAPAAVGGYTGLPEEQNNNGGSAAPAWLDGTYRAEQAEFSKSGYRAFVEVTVAGGKITAVKWDEYKKDSDTTKEQESIAGRYVMTETGAKWHEQAKTMEDALIAAGDPGKLVVNAETGKTDAYAGVSISVSPFVTLAQEALDKAKPVTLKDGTYRAEQAEFSKSGYRAFVEVTVAGGKITAVKWDEYKKDSDTTKEQESIAGQYVMTEMGAKWHEQAKAMEDALIAAGDPSKLVVNAETGKTDAYAGVSISVSHFVTLAQEALDKAKGAPSSGVVDAGVGNGEIDAVSGATISSKAVVRAANTAYLFVQGALKGNG